MTFTAQPVDANNILMSSAVPDGTNTPFAIEGGPAITTGGNTLVPVSVYGKDGNIVTVGAQADTAATSDGGTFSLMALIKRLLAKFPAIGPQVKASSLSVTIATDQPAGTFWQTTQPVSAASLPLPTGAATAAKQPALGTAGTPSADVLSVQGVASGTPIPVSSPAVGTDGSATPASSTLIGASDGTNLQGLQVQSAAQPNLRVALYNAGTLLIGQKTPGASLSMTLDNTVEQVVGSAVVANAVQVGASDGTNVQLLLLESAANKNLRTGLYQGANQLAIDASGRTQTITVIGGAAASNTNPYPTVDMVRALIQNGQGYTATIVGVTAALGNYVGLAFYTGAAGTTKNVLIYRVVCASTQSASQFIFEYQTADYALGTAASAINLKNGGAASSLSAFSSSLNATLAGTTISQGIVPANQNFDILQAATQGYLIPANTQLSVMAACQTKGATGTAVVQLWWVEY